MVEAAWINPRVPEGSDIYNEFKNRQRLEVISRKCFACGECEDTWMLSYPDNKEWYFTNMAVFSCGKCGFSYVPNKPYGLNEYYRTSYSDSKGRKHSIDPDTLFSDPVMLNAMGLKRSKRHISTLLKAIGSDIETAIDFGCGYGLTLSELPAGRKIGVEVDDKVVPYALSRGIEVVPSASDIADGIADVAICSHVLEHIPVADLNEFIDQIFRVIKPGGYALVEVPNAPLLQLNMSKAKHSPHLNFFTKQSLAAILRRAGWRIVDVHGVGKDRTLHRRPRYRPIPRYDARGGALVALMQRHSA